VKPEKLLGRVETPDGTELVLYRRDGVYTIRVGGMELMSSRAHGSEETMARRAAEQLAAADSPKVLIGGLGMGFTVRAALDNFPPDAVVVVVEVFEAVISWCRGPLADLAKRPLDDARVRVQAEDICDLVKRRDVVFNAILLDVDNGPEAFTMASNSRLYSTRGLRRLRECLTDSGLLVVWSASPDGPFENRLRRAGFAVTVEQVRAREGGRGVRHTLFLARR